MADLILTDADRIAALERLIASHQEAINALFTEVAKLNRAERLNPTSEADPAAIASLMNAASVAGEIEQGHLPDGLIVRDAPQ